MLKGCPCLQACCAADTLPPLAYPNSSAHPEVAAYLLRRKLAGKAKHSVGHNCNGMFVEGPRQLEPKLPPRL